MQESKVAPPHTSSEKKPTPSSFSAMGSMSLVRIRVAIRDWCASRSVVSVICTRIVYLHLFNLYQLLHTRTR